jgi:glutamate N-acetyltransferase/amino-acid N-acetyltransferase
VPPERARARSLALVSRREFHVPGFRAAGVHAGLKEKDPDLALMVSDVPATVAGVFTRSSVVGAPVEVSRERVRKGSARGVVVNSGIANVATGERGLGTARRMTEYAAGAVGCDSSEILVASTGVIGEPIPLGTVRRGIREASESLTTTGLLDAARAILTTDTVPKLALRRFTLAGREATIAGIAKGAGMCQPDMATMLAFLFTDANVAASYLRRQLREAADVSLNRVTVDGETSTSDMALLFANGEAGNPALRGPRSTGARAFSSALREVCVDLAQGVARDGEGATHLISVHIQGARNPAEAERAARRVANSPLVKTAIFGGDPNWGRILQTVGAAQVAVDLARVEISLGGVLVFRGGSSAGPAARRRAGERLREPEVEIQVDLASGRASAVLWTCDLSYDYVRVNAEYTT